MSHNQSHIIEQGLFRGTVGRYASGITIITGHDDQGPIGLTCQSFYSVSVDPPVWAEHNAGDHLIVLGRVIELGTSPATILALCCTTKANTGPSTSSTMPDACVGRCIGGSPTFLLVRL